MNDSLHLFTRNWIPQHLSCLENRRLVLSRLVRHDTKPNTARFSPYDDPRSLDTFPNPCYSSGFALELPVLQPVRLRRSTLHKPSAGYLGEPTAPSASSPRPPSRWNRLVGYAGDHLGEGEEKGFCGPVSRRAPRGQCSKEGGGREAQ